MIHTASGRLFTIAEGSVENCDADLLDSHDVPSKEECNADLWYGAIRLKQHL
jgi:hypothetical protein